MKTVSMSTDYNTEYIFKATVADHPVENVATRGTLVELAHEWKIIADLIRLGRDGSVDESLIYEPIELTLTIGLVQYKLFLADQ